MSRLLSQAAYERRWGVEADKIPTKVAKILSEELQEEYPTHKIHYHNLTIIDISGGYQKSDLRIICRDKHIRIVAYIIPTGPAIDINLPYEDIDCIQRLKAVVAEWANS